MMSVPRLSSLGRGIVVNIVLKEDQRTGRLTTGKIKDFLTKGDHPRGIKVRLEDGQIGRVQSLAVDSGLVTTEANLGQSSSKPLSSFKFQEDIRNQPQPPPTSEASLEDYIKIKPAKKGKSKKVDPKSLSDHLDTPYSEDSQASLEREFPTLDSSLVAAILSDSNDVDGARSVLQTLANSEDQQVA